MAEICAYFSFSFTAYPGWGYICKPLASSVGHSILARPPTSSLHRTATTVKFRQSWTENPVTWQHFCCFYYYFKFSMICQYFSENKSSSLLLHFSNVFLIAYNLSDWQYGQSPWFRQLLSTAFACLYGLRYSFPDAMALFILMCIISCKNFLD